MDFSFILIAIIILFSASFGACSPLSLRSDTHSIQRVLDPGNYDIVVVYPVTTINSLMAKAHPTSGIPFFSAERNVSFDGYDFLIRAHLQLSMPTVSFDKDQQKMIFNHTVVANQNSYYTDIKGKKVPLHGNIAFISRVLMGSVGNDSHAVVLDAKECEVEMNVYSGKKKDDTMSTFSQQLVGWYPTEHFNMGIYKTKDIPKAAGLSPRHFRVCIMKDGHVVVIISTLTTDNVPDDPKNGCPNVFTDSTGDFVPSDNDVALYISSRNNMHLISETISGGTVDIKKKTKVAYLTGSLNHLGGTFKDNDDMQVTWEIVSFHPPFSQPICTFQGTQDAELEIKGKDIESVASESDHIQLELQLSASVTSYDAEDCSLYGCEYDKDALLDLHYTVSNYALTVTPKYTTSGTFELSKSDRKRGYQCFSPYNIDEKQGITLNLNELAPKFNLFAASSILFPACSVINYQHVKYNGDIVIAGTMNSDASKCIQ